MKAVIAPDSFKGSLSAKVAAQAMERGLMKAGFESCSVVPMADGGEGTVEAFLTAVPGDLIQCPATGPLGAPVQAFYGVLEGNRAVIEMAAASGLPLLTRDQRNPLLATTCGTGELMVAAAKRGCKRFIVGIGGSATNDGGTGLARAMGVRFLDAQGNELPEGGAALAKLAHIDMSKFTNLFQGCEILVACDVDNPLCGEKGASAIFGPQKGATPQMVRQLDDALANYARVLKTDVGADIVNMPGAGAAGGLGGGMVAFLGAQLKRGIDIVIEAASLADKIALADVVLTGEGRTDAQTMFGKVPMGVAAIAMQQGKPAICISGGLGKGYEELFQMGLTAAFSIADGPMTLDTAIERADELLEAAALSVGRTILAFNR